METLTVDFSPIYEFQYCQIHNKGFNFLLLDEQNRALHSPFECKDYIQDIIYCETVGKSAGIYGIHWKPGMMNINVPTFKVALMGGGAELKSHGEFLKELLNEFEQAQGFMLSKIHYTEDPEVIVVEFSKEWSESGPLLSAFTTLLRLGGDYKSGEGAMAYLVRLHNNMKDINSLPGYMQKDVMNLPKFIQKYAALLAGKKVEHKWSDFTSMSAVHDTGILNYREFPTSSVEDLGKPISVYYDDEESDENAEDYWEDE